MKSLHLLTLFILIALPVLSFSQGQKIYDTEADANADIENALELAQKNDKHVFLQIGGNWCPWCIKFHNFVEADSEIKSYFGDNFEVVKVNYDSENKQEELLVKLGFPQRFGFPVFVILRSAKLHKYFCQVACLSGQLLPSSRCI